MVDLPHFIEEIGRSISKSSPQACATPKAKTGERRPRIIACIRYTWLGATSGRGGLHPTMDCSRLNEELGPPQAANVFITLGAIPWALHNSRHNSRFHFQHRVLRRYLFPFKAKPKSSKSLRITQRLIKSSMLHTIDKEISRLQSVVGGAIADSLPNY